MGLSSKALTGAIVVVGTFVLGAADALADVIEADHAVHGAGTLTRDSDQGLDFLDLSFTNNQNFNTVLGKLVVGGEFEGFRFATETEVLTLGLNYGFTPAPMAGQATVENATAKDLDDLVELLGANFTNRNGAWASGLTSTVLPDGKYRAPRFNNSFSNVDWVYSTNAFNHATASASYGSFLVQASPGGPVPEPGTLALLGLGMAGLGWHRRRKMRAS